MTYPLKLASRLDPIKPSITLAVTAKAARLKADGVDIVSFGAGEPDFDTPEHIKAAARAALDKPGVGKYTEVAGVVALRKAIAAELVALADRGETAAEVAGAVRAMRLPPRRRRRRNACPARVESTGQAGSFPGRYRSRVRPRQAQAASRSQCHPG